ncbi:MAG: hypothetical protein WCA11_04215, partial [Terracidiphilus sp.]
NGAVEPVKILAVELLDVKCVRLDDLFQYAVPSEFSTAAGLFSIGQAGGKKTCLPDQTCIQESLRHS